MKIAIITGVLGQDGSLLAKHLLKNRYRVIGVCSLKSNSSFDNLDMLGIKDSIEIKQCDLSSLEHVLELVKENGPHEIYHLAAQSSVGRSLYEPYYTITNNYMTTLNLLEAIRLTDRQIIFFHASSGEIFGHYCKSKEQLSVENTPVNPCSPYGASKASSHQLVQVYRTSYKIKAINGILFNHESYLRAPNFITKKIISNALIIKNNPNHILELGNIDVYRDWGCAHEYVEIIHSLVCHEFIGDYNISSGEYHSIQEFLEEVFNQLGINCGKNVKIDEALKRENDIKFMGGDNTKLKKTLKDLRLSGFKEIIKKLIEHETKS